MDGNQIIGSIPEGIGNLVNQDVVDMAENFLVSEIPISIRNLQNLEALYLGFNQVTGKIPSSIGNLSRLSNLDLSHNKFEEAIPLSLGKCKNLQTLDLSQNKLNGNLGKVKLVELYVDNYNFFGEIPKALGESLELRILFMQINSFEGNIPQSFASLRSLESLDLSGNTLSGNIPPELQKLPFLVSLNVSFNQLEGEVPKGRVYKNTSGFSFFRNEKLCGGIPELELPKCIDEKPNKRERGLIPVALFGDAYLCLSYKELLQATQGFASSNLIGSGSFGILYKGVLHQQEKIVAVKIITSCTSIDYKGNAVKALVFEFMHNGSLESWLHEKHESRYLKLVQRLDIAIDVANAIDYLCHDCETPIVHCDLKPTNVLLDNDMVAHVGDFELAKLLSSYTSNMCNKHLND
ncbi:receptor kinase-like protein Xa21 [Durio zibethinus]|uniref:Receptor kinase-like protein Xa21 n=1 Tax=Durio zibethinus TaxID=66656 RepID=A0A6P5ZNL2_DURZI|nr:receptor kinase-like protein Xa21 [Durio zibethinus]